MFRFGGGGTDAAPFIISVVCGPISTKFCTEIDNQSISSNIEKQLCKINEVIDNDIIIMRKLVETTVKKSILKSLLLLPLLFNPSET